MNMEDVYAIQSLLYQYCWTLDAGDLEGVCNLFKDAEIFFDGKFAFRNNPKAYKNTLKPIILYEDGTPKTSHMCVNPVITIDPSGYTASSKSYTIVVQGVTGKLQPQIIWVDRKYDTFVKEDGKWRFRSRNSVTRAEGDTSCHMKPFTYGSL